MNRQGGALDGDQHQDFDQIAGPIRADDEPTVRVFADVVDDQRMVDGVEQVIVRDAVATGRGVDVHLNTVLRKPKGDTRWSIAGPTRSAPRVGPIRDLSDEVVVVGQLDVEQSDQTAWIVGGSA